MAKYIVPPKRDGDVIIKCNGCGTLYVPDKGKHPYGDPTYFERCPVCGYSTNSKYQIIPLWKYNLIKWYRSWFDRDKPDVSCTDD